MMLLLAVLPIAFAGNIENNYIYEYGTNQPLNNAQGLMFTCTDSSCTNVIGGAWYNQNSGASNLLTIEYPGAASITYYAKYIYVSGYLPGEGDVWDWGDDGVYNYDEYMYKADGCHAPVDSLALTNTIYENEPMIVNYQALVDSTVTSAFRMSSAPPYYVPAGFNDYYSQNSSSC